MKTIKSTTKKGMQLIEKANQNVGYYLNDVYGKYSEAKKNAWEWCYNKCKEEEGENFHIVSFNTNCFTVAWETVKGVRIETAHNSYLVTM